MLDDRPTQSLPAATAPAGPFFSWPVFIASSLVMLCAEGVLMVYLPRMKEVFDALHLRMPAITLLLLNTSQAARGWGWLAFVVIPIFLGAVAPGFMPKTPPAAPLHAARRFNRLAGFLIMLWSLFFLIALIAPMIWLLKGVSSHSNSPPR